MPAAFALRAAALFLCLISARATLYTLSAGAASLNGQWDFTKVYPNGLVPPFTIQEGDAITFVVGGANKTVTFTDRPFIPLIDTSGNLDPSLLPSGPSPIYVWDTNDTYSSGLLAAGQSFTFVFPVAGTYPFMDVIQGTVQSTIAVTTNATAAPYSPFQISTFAADQISYTNTLLQGYSSTAAALAGPTKILLGWASPDTGASSLLPVGGNPLTVVISGYTPASVTFSNADNRRHSLYISISGVLPTNRTLFLLPTATTTVDGTADVSGGVVYPTGAVTVTFTVTGTFLWYDFLAGNNGSIIVTANNVPKSAGAYVGAFFVVVGVVILIIVIGTILLVACDYCCVARRKLEKSLTHFSSLEKDKVEIASA